MTVASNSLATFNRQKMLDVVHYIVANCTPEELGNVKLHKVLYFADMLHFVHTGRPLTGVEYLKQKFGPCARHLNSVVSSLSKNNKIKVSRRDYFGFTKIDYISIAAPPNKLDNVEIAIIDACMNYVCQRTAKEISELSHNAAWELVKFGEVIPYETAYWLQHVEVTQEDVNEAVEQLRAIPEFSATT
ncbi:MAG: DUF4065 domain-containing protein [Gammaproteobacteria bacterium]|nr:DUF4065 domain-containing protein [Gammaproteobacteria bacterium]